MDEASEDVSGDVSSMLSDEVVPLDDGHSSQANHRFVLHILIDLKFLINLIVVLLKRKSVL